MENRAKGEKPYQLTEDKGKLLEQAAKTKPDYDQAMNRFLDDIKEQNPRGFGSVMFHAGSLKTIDRIEAKIQSDYGGNVNEIADIVRGTFTADTPEELLRVQEALEDKFEIVRVKDNVFEPMETGLRNFNTNIRMTNGHIVEAQVMPSQLWDIKEHTHALMEDIQKIERSDMPISADDASIQSALSKDARLSSNIAVHDTGLNEYMNPEWDHRQQAPFRVTFDPTAQFSSVSQPDAQTLTYKPDATDVKLNLIEGKGILLTGGLAITAGGLTLFSGGSPAQAGEAMVETVKPEYWDAGMMAVHGDKDGAFEEFVKVTPGVVGCGGGGILGAFGGGGWGSIVTGAAGCEGGARIVDNMARPYVNKIIAEHRYPAAQLEADLAAQQAITPDPEILALYDARRDEERAALYAGYDAAALNAATRIDTDILPPNLEVLKYRLGGELPEEMLPKIPTGNPDLVMSDDAQWLASTEGEINGPYTEASQLIERINDPYNEMDPVEYRQGYGYLTNSETPVAAINLLESRYPDGMQKLRDEELNQLDKKAREAAAEIDRKLWLEQQQREFDLYNTQNAQQTQQMAAGVR
ncbi:MAG: hypothetical protein OEY94_05520 [Alphaproteobacteria bacterium]|nr:hypothetical protein [Alphaproteobacteria bacterium]